MRQPVCEFPCRFQKSLEEASPVFVCVICQGDAANVIGPFRGSVYRYAARGSSGPLTGLPYGTERRGRINERGDAGRYNGRPRRHPPRKSTFTACRGSARVFVGREQKVKTWFFRHFQQNAVRNPVPAAFYRLRDLVPHQHFRNPAWGAVVKEYAHQSRCLTQQKPEAHQGYAPQIRVRPESVRGLHETAR